MKHQRAWRLVVIPTIAATMLAMGAMATTLEETSDPSPGGTIVSARSAMAVPVAGGHGVAAPIARDGTFKFLVLKTGKTYRFAITSRLVPRQTRGASFGDKVNATADRISMNVTVARQYRTMDLDGAPIEVEVDRDGTLVGRVERLQLSSMNVL
jgi:hypothetical protein